MALWWRLTVVYMWACQWPGFKFQPWHVRLSKNVKAVFGRSFLSTVENGPQNGGFVVKWSLHFNFVFCDPKKGTLLCGNTPFDIFFVKISAGVLAVGDLKNKKNSQVNIWVRKVAHAGNETPKLISVKFCTMVDIPCIITYAKVGDDHLRDLKVAGDQILPFPIDFDHRPYNTSHYHASVWLQACSRIASLFRSNFRTFMQQLTGIVCTSYSPFATAEFIVNITEDSDEMTQVRHINWLT